MKVLFVLTSHDQLGNTGRKTGFWLEELAAPYYVFKDAGAEITLASPKGGQPPLDPKSNEPSFQTDQTRRFETDPVSSAQLAMTVTDLPTFEAGDHLLRTPAGRPASLTSNPTRGKHDIRNSIEAIPRASGPPARRV